MLSFEFDVDEDMVARTIVHHCEHMERYRRYITEEQINYLWALDRMSYNALKNSPFAFVDEKIINAVKSMDFFPKAMEDSKKNMARIEKVWTKYQDKVNEYLKNALRTDFDLENLKAYIVSPDIGNGNSNIQERYIAYGHRGGLSDEIYDVVYVTHEALHILLGNKDIPHAILTMIADRGLNEFLNGEFKQYSCGDFNGLSDLIVRIFPYWNLYLNKSDEEIENACKTYHINYNKQSFECLRTTLNELNIFEFISWITRNNIYKIKFTAEYNILDD